jgi:hypothetical protein
MSDNEFNRETGLYLKREIAKGAKQAAQDARVLQEIRSREAKRRRAEDRAVAEMIGAKVEELDVY